MCAVDGCPLYIVAGAPVLQESFTIKIASDITSITESCDFIHIQVRYKGIRLIIVSWSAYITFDVCVCTCVSVRGRVYVCVCV